MMGHYTTRATCNSCFPADGIKGFALQSFVISDDRNAIHETTAVLTAGNLFGESILSKT